MNTPGHRTSAEIAKSVAQKRAQRCRHFNGIQHKTCEAGVCYEDLGKLGLIPCLPWHNDPGKPVAPCDKYGVYSAEELAEQERKINEHLERIEKVMASIQPLRAQVRLTKQSFAGRIDCAACGGKGTLALNISNYNCRARGKCSACDVGWIE